MSDYEEPAFLARLDMGQLQDEMAFFDEHIPKLQAVFEPGHRLIVMAKTHRVQVENALKAKGAA